MVQALSVQGLQVQALQVQLLTVQLSTLQALTVQPLQVQAFEGFGMCGKKIAAAQRHSKSAGASPRTPLSRLRTISLLL